MDLVKIDVTRGVLTATMADVENRNALGAELLAGVTEAIQRADADPAIRAVVLTNEGSTFCAGANLKQRSATKTQGSDSGGYVEVLQAIRSSSTPVIGRIAGHVMGGGNGLAAALDISIAAEDVKFGFTEVRLGVAPAMVAVVCLPKMRPADAMEVFLRGNRFPATRAAELGLITRAVPVDRLDAAVDEVLEDLRKGGPTALAMVKRIVHELPTRTESDAFEWMTRLSNELFAGEEAKEGMQAFLTKRPARWVGSED